MIATAIQTAEIVTLEPANHRGLWMFDALRQTSASVGVRVTQAVTYRGGADVLMLWGPGAPNRRPLMDRQLAAGGHVAAFDLAYWARDRKVRVSIDAAHPQAWILRHDWPATRFEHDRPRVANRWDPEGPVVIAGIGEKAKAQYGSASVQTWEAAMARAAIDAGRRVLYRRKRGGGQPVPGSTLASDTTAFEEILDGASRLVTWHSNMAVDAIRLGIPVICRDGAAAAVCPSEWSPTPQPLDVATRDRFLQNLAWFQWALTHDEARGLWAFLQALLT